MTILNISLPEDLKTFREEQVAQGEYNTTEDYIQNLIRKEQQKQEQQKQIESMLIEGLDSGELIEAPEEWWDKKQL